MQVTVRYFAQLKERFGKEEEKVVLQEGATSLDLLRNLLPDPKEFEQTSSYLRVAVNESMGSLQHPLHDGDQVVFMTPVAGG